MKISLAQTLPVAGNIEANIKDHLHFVQQAADENADLIVFSELSLTGYEPDLAKELAIDLGDQRLDPFQELSNANDIIICVGAPTKADNGICISLVIFRPNKERSLYSKQYLHEDEDPYFVSGPPSDGIIEADKRVALAICYELTIPEHSKAANQNGAEVYIASVAKTVNGVARNNPRLSQIAKQYKIPVLMCNCVGEFDGNIGGGQSGLWNSEGELVESLDENQSSLVLLTL
ncbi:carbon-nitrogen hydrolase family protein [Roseivirga sp. E12]|uniref:carbon-nitrogen hydrolase family protein n=1 Tax=Roseivirga sp. E12 TaxID=2819237 RepID=UPI001ABC1B8A|nr:carbon-nitrogen hydrolase family protein [Roseivirga sp. E12]MBO3699108.1 carbon-nitrogen hydrolase family protein [Roseivirga sp. E12]